MSYFDAVHGLARPSHAQVEGFVEYAFGAHSWYKHLPRFLPGKPFSFYLDPSVGYAVETRPDGSTALVERREGEGFFHYNEMPTRRYLERFGHLAYNVAAGTRVALVDPAGVARWGGTDLAGVCAKVQVFSPEHGVIDVPQEVLAAGTVELTGVIHSLTDCAYEWERCQGPLTERPWPDESGGRAALARLSEVVERSRADSDGSVEAAMAVQAKRWEGSARHAYDVYEIIAPERERQRRGAIQAIEGMLDQVFAGR